MRPGGPLSSRSTPTFSLMSPIIPGPTARHPPRDDHWQAGHHRYRRPIVGASRHRRNPSTPIGRPDPSAPPCGANLPGRCPGCSTTWGGCSTNPSSDLSRPPAGDSDADQGATGIRSHWSTPVSGPRSLATTHAALAPPHGVSARRRLTQSGWVQLSRKGHDTATQGNGKITDWVYRFAPGGHNGQRGRSRRSRRANSSWISGKISYHHWTRPDIAHAIRRPDDCAAISEKCASNDDAGPACHRL